MEGPSVHALADELQFFMGQEIEGAGGNARQPIGKLEGRKIEGLKAVKKRLFFRTGEILTVVHFLMYGSYRVNKERKEKEERLYLDCTEDRLNLYDCSAKIFEKGDEEVAGYDEPEADMLSESFDEEKALAKIEKDDRIIADVLLDQGIFGGVGNIMKNGILLESRIHPETIASELPEEEARRLIDTAVGWGRSWLQLKRDGEKKEFQIYRQGSCKKCGSNINQQKLGEHDRITFSCPNCQNKYR